MLKMWHCPHSHTTAAVMIDISCLVGPTAANLQQWRAVAGQNRQTDGRMDGKIDRQMTGQLHRLCSTYYAGSTNNYIFT